MGFLIFALVVLAGFFAFVFYTDRISLSVKPSKFSRTLLFVFLGVGIILCALSLVLLTINLNTLRLESTAKDVIKDTFKLFVVADSIYIALGLLVTLVSSVIKSRLRVFIPFILPMWAAISYFWTFVCTIWAEYLGFSATPYIIMFGIGASLLLVISALPDVQRRIALLSDPAFVESVKKQRAGKKKYKEDKKKERKRIARLKKKLKHPKG